MAKAAGSLGLTLVLGRETSIACSPSSIYEYIVLHNKMFGEYLLQIILILRKSFGEKTCKISSCH